MNFTYRIIRSKRRSVSVHITRDGMVEARAPYRVPAAVIDEFVRKNEDKVSERLELVRRQAEARSSFSIRPGDWLMYLGREYPALAGGGKGASFDGMAFYLPKNAEEPRQVIQAVSALYRRLAKAYLSVRALELSRTAGLEYTGLRITGAKTRWGSCSGRNSLSFSWRLVLAPPEAVDYVILHELAHTRHHNHSERFWSLVRRFVPDYEKWQTTLRSMAQRLALEEWDMR